MGRRKTRCKGLAQGPWDPGAKRVGGPGTPAGSPHRGGTLQKRRLRGTTPSSVSSGAKDDQADSLQVCERAHGDANDVRRRNREVKRWKVTRGKNILLQTAASTKGEGHKATAVLPRTEWELRKQT